MRNACHRALAVALVALACAAVARAADPRAELAVRGVDVDEGALVYRASVGDEPAVRLLLAAGVDPNASFLTGETALEEAAAGAHVAIVRELLDAGADPNARAGGWTPLIAAVEENYLVIGADPAAACREVLGLLLDRGADPNARDADGKTALMHAAERSDAETVRLLLARGARADLGDDAGKSAVSYAAARDAHYDQQAAEVVRELMAAGSRDGLWLTVEYRCYQFARLEGWLTPLALALAIVLLWIGRRAPVPPKKNRVGGGDGLPRLGPLKCEKCGAPVPIAAHDCSCPSCGSLVDIPDDYEATLALRAKAADDLRRATQTWRWARWHSSRFVTAAAKLAGVVWLPATIVGMLERTGTMPTAVILSAGLGGAAFAPALVGYGIYLVGTRKMLRDLPRIGRVAGPALVSSCDTCGAPVAFREGELATTCSYCGGELFRPDVARDAHVGAASDEARAATSLYDAVVALRTRRRAACSSVLWAASIVLLLAAFIFVFGDRG